MLLRFSPDKSHVLFQVENPKENKVLAEFPGLIKLSTQDASPAILPVVYNLVQRITLVLTAKKLGLRIENTLKEWLDQPFNLLPLPEDFHYHTTPKKFQDIALRFLYTLSSAGILLDPGMGKTKVVLDYIFLKKFNKSIVVCPAALLFVWEDEIKRHRPELSFYIVQSTDWEKELPSIQKHDVIIINYNKLVILKHRIKSLKIDFIHLDEFLIKDPTTARTKTVIEISKGIPYRCGGSGTLINNTPLDAFSPVRYLQPALVGWNYGTFMNRYCVMVNMATGEGVTSKRPVGFKNQTEIKSILDSCCIVMKKEQWLVLPQKHFHDIYVQMNPEQKEVYYNLCKNYFATYKDKSIKVDNPLVMLAKLYQISQGFLYTTQEGDEDSIASLFQDSESATPSKSSKAKREVTFFDGINPKVEALRKLLTETLAGKKAIIWFNLSAEFELIKRLIEELGHPFISIQGGDKKIGEKVRTFNASPHIPWLVCQAQSVNYGITVLGTRKVDLDKENLELFPNIDPTVHTEVFFSLNFSLEIYSQQQDRIHRLGQEQECHYYRIFCNNPIESKIRKAIEDKMVIRTEMLVDVSNTVMADIFEEISIQH